MNEDNKVEIAVLQESIFFNGHIIPKNIYFEIEEESNNDLSTQDR